MGKKPLTIKDCMALAKERGFSEEEFLNDFDTSHLEILEHGGVLVFNCTFSNTPGIGIQIN